MKKKKRIIIPNYQICYAIGWKVAEPIIERKFNGQTLKFNKWVTDFIQALLPKSQIVKIKEFRRSYIRESGKFDAVNLIFSIRKLSFRLSVRHDRMIELRVRDYLVEPYVVDECYSMSVLKKKLKKYFTGTRFKQLLKDAEHSSNIKYQKRMDKLNNSLNNGKLNIKYKKKEGKRFMKLPGNNVAN